MAPGPRTVSGMRLYRARGAVTCANAVNVLANFRAAAYSAADLVRVLCGAAAADGVKELT